MKTIDSQFLKKCIEELESNNMSVEESIEMLNEMLKDIVNKNGK